MRVLELLPAFAAIMALLMSLPLMSAQAREGASMQVECAGGRGFELWLGKEQAVVETVDRRLVLDRRPSSLGQQFRAAGASLIIDGDFVAFVAQYDLAWRDCHIVVKERQRR